MPVAVPGDDEQRVVDADAQSDEGAEGRPEMTAMSWRGVSRPTVRMPDAEADDGGQQSAAAIANSEPNAMNSTTPAAHDTDDLAVGRWHLALAAMTALPPSSTRRPAVAGAVGGVDHAAGRRPWVSSVACASNVTVA